MIQTIQIDSREKAKAIESILREFDQRGVKHFISKLYVGDYMNLDNPRIVVDRKQNLNEVCGNLCSKDGHERFAREIDRAAEAGIKVVVLVEHGNGIECLEDVAKWQNPRHAQNPKSPTGLSLKKTMESFARHHGCEFEFCRKAETGKRILEILEAKK